MLDQLSAAKREKLANIDPNARIEEIPDSDIKYDKILEKVRADPEWKYVDTEFNHEDALSSLGPEVNDSLASRGLREMKWVRARDIPNAMLFKDTVSHRDVFQGALGDCYFLSAISVLGGPAVKDIICGGEDYEWKKTGCFKLKFYKDGQPELVIIDDWLPCDG